MASLEEAFQQRQQEREKPIVEQSNERSSKRTYPLNPPNDMCNGCLEDRGSTVFVKTMSHTCYKHFEDIFKVKPVDAWGFDPNKPDQSVIDKAIEYMNKNCKVEKGAE